MSEIIKNKKSNALLLFTNSPGVETKFKDIRSGVITAKRFNCFFLKRILFVIEIAKACEDFDLIISSDDNFLRNYSRHLPQNKTKFTFIKQRGKDFGEKFSDGIRQVFNSGYKKVVTIGNDSPDISPGIICDSFKKLETAKSTVIGPSIDGGFYLLGLNGFNPELFNKIKWHSEKTLSGLTKNIANLGLVKILLPRLYDLDSSSDINIWIKTKSVFSELFKKIFFAFTAIPLRVSKNYIPFSKFNYNCKRIPQKSPPVLSLPV